MKKINLSFQSLIALLILIFVISVSADKALSSDDGGLKNNSVTVQGSSSITVSPTMAYVNIGVTTFHKDAAAAQSENAAKMNNVYEALSSLGISRNKIKTVTYSISPRYDYRNNVTELAGYNVTNAIQVTITNLKKVSSLLDMTVKQGINQSNSISFGITDEERNKIYLQALAQAVANAKEKAVSIAAAAGIKLSQPSSIIEDSQERTAPLNYRSMDMAKMEMGSEPTAISEGELKVEANVTVTYNY